MPSKIISVTWDDWQESTRLTEYNAFNVCDTCVLARALSRELGKPTWVGMERFGHNNTVKCRGELGESAQSLRKAFDCKEDLTEGEFPKEVEVYLYA